MKKLLTTAACALIMSTAAAQADDVKIGVLLGFTGPIESLVAQMAPGAEMAINEVSKSGAFLNGATLTAIRADTTCVDAAAATAAAERLITTDGVSAIVGGDCSGVTGAVLQNVARPNGIVMISPSATSPALTAAEDDGLFFRTAPSDARQGAVVADILAEKGVKSIALTYTNNDYGKGLADSIQENFTAQGGKVTISAAHEDGKGDYSAEVGALAQAGGDILVVAGYADQGGRGIIQSSLDSGAFDTFYLVDGMVGASLPEAIGDALNGSYGAAPGTDSPGNGIFQELAKGNDFDPTSPYAGETYDAAALILLAMQAAGSSNSADFKGKVFDVANAPGEKIYPGELAKGLKILAEGGDIDYVGASAVELIGPGESAGSYRQIEIKDEAISTVKYR